MKVFEYVPKRNVAQRLLYPVYRLHLENELEERCTQWESEFGDLFPDGLHYDRQAWRRDAFEGDTDWDKWMPDDWKRLTPRKPKTDFWDSYFAHFHRAAPRQRHYVLEAL